MNSNAPKISIHHVTPLSNMLLGRQECNKLKMDHEDHTGLHKICDADKSIYTQNMDKLYGQINNDLLLSLGAVDEIYHHLSDFFSNFEQLPIQVRKELGTKRKQIIMYHLNQWPEMTNTDGDSYWKLRKTSLEEWGEIITANDIEYIISQDKSIVKDIMLHLARKLKKHNICRDILSPDKTTTNQQYMIPLRIRGKNMRENQIFCKKSIYNAIISGVRNQGGINLRGVRDQTNGKYILGTEERKQWYEVQHKYLLKIEKVINNDFGDNIGNIYYKTIQRQLGQHIDQWNKIQKNLGDKNIYIQKNTSFHAMHEEITQLSGMMGDRIKELLLEDYCFI